MTVTVNGTTGVSLVQDSTITSAKIVDGTIAPADLNGAQSGSAPIYGCRAWCVFDGTLAGPITPSGAGNVSTITKNGTGDYTINFTTAMPSGEYAIVGTTLEISTGTNADVKIATTTNMATAPTLKTSTQCRIYVGSASLVDAKSVSIVVFG